MPPDADPSVTQLLQAMGAGDVGAGDELLRRLYTELKDIARRQLRATPPGQTLQATALVNEACLRLLGKQERSWENRRHFFFTAARAMRDIVVEGARRKAAAKRGGGLHRIDVDRLEIAIDAPAEDMLALDEALKQLEQDHPRLAEIVQLRFFAGLSEEETARALDLSTRTIRRDWRFIRARLYRDLGGESA